MKAITAAESERGNITLYIRYIRASNQDFITSKFVDGERLLVLSDLEYGLSIIKENSPFATAVSENATGTGSAAFIEEGIYFIRGFFVKVQSSTILLDQYTNTPSYRIGLLVSEEIVTSFDDSDLNDNSQDFLISLPQAQIDSKFQPHSSRNQLMSSMMKISSNS